MQKGPAAARRTQILEAAATVFAEKGFHPATIRDVAWAAGVADGTIYNCFENKPALLLGRFEFISTRAQKNIDPASFAGLSQCDFIAAYLAHSLRALEADNFEWFRVIVSEMMVNLELRGRFSAQVLEPMLAGGEAAFGRWAAQNGDSGPAATGLGRRSIGRKLGRLASNASRSSNRRLYAGSGMNPADLLTVPLSSLTQPNMTDPAFKADPFPFYARLREEAPVFPITLKLRGQQRAWLVTRYEDVLAVLKDDRRFVKDKHNAMSPEQLRRAPKLRRGSGRCSATCSVSTGPTMTA
ncbi:TetR/AcrR family transcriptional regulator [Deinococcus sp. QL22]|uniref:TetR/AcrR family transcriptional regulator n=1 Tax=Deinococcus sp. QL22 TaxID=2939437 RepID=UPI002016EFA5|nr:TetR/AcrR family transcriptional regulator [Deinococcus sp. QL22]UQN09918.1 TetR family transcriptional regulator [Deinococcus sp. QL22]